MPKFLRSLFGQVVLALLVGVAIGLAAPEFAIKLKPLGDAFIKLIKMIIPVLVFCVVVHGIAGVDSFALTVERAEGASAPTGDPIAAVTTA